VKVAFAFALVSVYDSPVSEKEKFWFQSIQTLP
jgi:hypothetical protein